MNSLAAKTKMEPGWNAWQYLFVFAVGFVGDLIVHFFSRRKFYANKSGDDVFGFAPSLMYYYHSLRNMWPLQGGGEFTQTFNVWFWGGMFGGIACVIALLGADIIMQIIESNED